ncbi:ATPase, T2SS/T4P/T4SS family [Paenibacillus sp. GCM10012307]|uniref:Flp pilus assembly complex ATPase component TadA n=1 Tax=Paenibacillus roseus TaxID=2798579 RepID=A0A934J758_9BACL|nr:CpaF/VirB11 family protein [Paenibacillus roseus]MBJ6361528.1 Flp pilus assembly complex ATPase component TadA [Paenibacillus roseus]
MNERSTESRFSPSEYAARLGLEQIKSERGPATTDHRPEQEFSKLAEDIRSYLAAPRGSTEEERRQHNERLNRAVLGFRQEREEVLAMITDRLIRHRVHQIAGYNHPYPTLAEALFAEVIGLNVLELVLLHKEGLEEIQVVGTQIFEVKGGHAAPSSYSFDNVHDVERIQQNLVLYNNDRINPRKRWAEVMLSDGSRVTMTGFGFTSEPTLTLRFYTVRHFDLRALCSPEVQTMNEHMLELIRHILVSRFNVVIIGPTNSGKTHLIKSLIAELPDEERIVTIENRLEMRLRRDFPNKNIVEYETDEEDGLHNAPQAFKLALRQSPQRIIHAEIRDEDANIYVRACTRGHSGSMTTVHANTLEDVPEAITDMCMLDGRAMNPERLMKRITEYVTQVGIEMRQVDGKRRIVRIGGLYWTNGQTEVKEWVHYDRKQGTWVFHEIAGRPAYGSTSNIARKSMAQLKERLI